MPRPLRPIDDGLIYHVINRGNNGQKVFRKEADFQAFLAALAKLKERKPFKLYGYCLLNDHFHLLLRPIGETTISRVMQSLLISHTQRYHHLHRSGGHVWQGRFKSPVIQNGEHLLAMLRYVEASPLRAKMVRRAEKYPWSSYGVHGLGEENELVDSLSAYEAISPQAKARQRKWGVKVHQPMKEAELEGIRRSILSGLPFGNPAWVKRLSKRLGLDLTIRPPGRPRKKGSSGE